MSRTIGALGFKYSHEALADAIIANPTATRAELAAMFGRSLQWITMVRNADSFLEILHRRRGDTVDPTLAATLEERFSLMANRSAEILLEKLEKDSKDVPDGLALQALALGAKGLGVGGFSSKPAAPPPTPDVNRIERLAQRLENLNGPRARPQEITDVIPIGERNGV
jgi:hypothetical protein